MPLYEYTCSACARSFERRLSYAARLEPQPCPECGHRRTALRFSAPAPLRTAAEPAPTCPSTGGVCGCGHPGRN